MITYLKKIFHLYGFEYIWKGKLKFFNGFLKYTIGTTNNRVCNALTVAET